MGSSRSRSHGEVILTPRDYPHPTFFLPRRMAYRKRYNRYMRRRRVRNVPLYPGSSTKVVHLQYRAYSDLVSTVGAINSVVLRANCPYDPLFSVGGSACVAWTAASAEYDHYVVLSSRMKIKWLPQTYTALPTGGHYPTAVLGLNLTAAPSLAGDWFRITCNRYSRHKLVLLDSSQASRDLIGGTMTLNYNPYDFFGTKDPVDDRDYIGAATNAVPTEGAFFIPWIQAQDLSSTTSYARATYVIDYWVLLCEPKQINAY